MLKEKIEKIQALVEACNQVADDRVFTYKVSETLADRFAINIECKNTAYRNELRTLVTLIDMLHPTLDESEIFVQLH